MGMTDPKDTFAPLRKSSGYLRGFLAVNSVGAFKGTAGPHVSEALTPSGFPIGFVGLADPAGMVKVVVLKGMANLK